MIKPGDKVRLKHYFDEALLEAGFSEHWVAFWINHALTLKLNKVYIAKRHPFHKNADKYIVIEGTICPTCMFEKVSMTRETVTARLP